MKKLLLGLLFACGLNSGYADVVNNITDKVAVDLEALYAAEGKLSTKESRTDMMIFFIEHQGQKLSATEILTYCLSIDDRVHCAEFIRGYTDYVGGGAGDCTQATGLIGRRIIGANNDSHNFETFGDAQLECAKYGHGSGGVDAYGNIVAGSSAHTQESIYGICERFVGAVRRCIRHLSAYYQEQVAAAQNSNDTKAQKKYNCLLVLVQTGQLNLPVSLMEESCNRQK